MPMTTDNRAQWFHDARLGLFIHWGPYAEWGRGEQVLLRERLDQNEYARAACAWNPTRFDAARWAEIARSGGFRYAVLTARHHDGYCLWDSKRTDYSSARQAPGRDFVREYVEAFRAAGLRVGLYYSWGDFRIPAYFEGPDRNPDGWRGFVEYCHEQVAELLGNYGKIDLLWFDGVWAWSARAWRSAALVERARRLQPGILINNRLDTPNALDADARGVGAGESAVLGDFGTPEHHITAEKRPWESCQVSTWRLWGYTLGERWRPADLLLDMLAQCACQGGNLLLNVGPRPDGELPGEFVDRAEAIGRWIDRHGEAVFETDGGDVTEFVTRGYQTTRGNTLYLIIRFWDGRPRLRLADLVTPVRRATLLTTGAALDFEQTANELILKGLPVEPPPPLFPVIKLECEGKPESNIWGRERLWTGDPKRYIPWTRARGDSVWADGRPR